MARIGHEKWEIENFLRNNGENSCDDEKAKPRISMLKVNRQRKERKIPDKKGKNGESSSITIERAAQCAFSHVYI